MRAWLRDLACRAATEMWAEARQMGAHGDHEVAATLFNGSAYVMYPRGHHDDPQIEKVDRAIQPQIEREM